MFNFLRKSSIFSIYETLNLLKFYLQKLPIIRKFWKNDSFAMTGIKNVFSKISIVGRWIMLLIRKFIYVFIYLGISGTYGKIITDLFSDKYNGYMIFLTIYAYVGIFNFFRFFMSSGEAVNNLIFYDLLKIPARTIGITQIVILNVLDILALTAPMLVIDLQANFGVAFVIKLQLMYLAGRYISNVVNMLFLGKRWKTPNKNIILATISVVMVVVFIAKDILFKITPYEFLNSNILFAIMMVLGLASLYYLIKIANYEKILSVYSSEFNQTNLSLDNAEIFKRSSQLKEEDVEVAKKLTDKKLKGYPMLNEIFFQRHRRLIFRPIIIKALIGLLLIGGFTVATSFINIGGKIADPASAFKEVLGQMPSLIPFATYMLFHNESITRIMFINCDEAFLQYDFYNRPKDLLEMFKLRLLKILKWNSLGLIILLIWIIGGSFIFEADKILMATAIIQSISLWVFFTVHTLFVYYIFQPYNDKYEAKHPVYTIINIAIYVICYATMLLSPSGFYVAPLFIAIAIIYVVVALKLVYRISPKTFTLRMRK